MKHRHLDMLRQRVFGIALGYEDLNDHDGLRHDLGLQTAAGRDAALASAQSLCRFENRAEPWWAWAIHEVLADVFIASFAASPAEADRARHGCHRRCSAQPSGGAVLPRLLRPLLLPAALRVLGRSSLGGVPAPGRHRRGQARGRRVEAAGGTAAAWPEVRIVVRADSGFCRRRLLGWCERNGVAYIIGVARNARLVALAAAEMEEAEAAFQATGVKQRRFAELAYAANTGDMARRVIARLEHGPKGANPRFVVTNLEGRGRDLCDGLYCARGETENRIKEQQLDLFADRTSCHKWWPNQFRLLLAGLAYTVMAAIRRLGLAGTEMARAQCATIRLELLKVGAVIVRNTRRVRFMLSSACPDQDPFRLAAVRLEPG